MNEQKWLEFCKEVVPKINEISALINKYGIEHFSTCVMIDGFSDSTVVDGKKFYSLTKLDESNDDYKVRANHKVLACIKKEQQ